jgi:hypothetical protein
MRRKDLVDIAELLPIPRIIPCMRRGFSFVLVLLLVLRGLLGDAMAMGKAPMLAPTATAHHHMLASTTLEGLHLAMDHGSMDLAAPQAAGHHAHEEHGSPASHGLHAPQDASSASAEVCSPNSAGPACHAHEGMASCSACGICHSVLSQPSLPALPQAQAPGTLRPLSGARFASAPAALLIKPPIS